MVTHHQYWDNSEKNSSVVIYNYRQRARKIVCHKEEGDFYLTRGTCSDNGLQLSEVKAERILTIITRCLRRYSGAIRWLSNIKTVQIISPMACVLTEERQCHCVHVSYKKFSH